MTRLACLSQGSYPWLSATYLLPRYRASRLCMMLKMASSVMIITVCSCQFCQPRYFPVILISKRVLQASSPTLKRKKRGAMHGLPFQGVSQPPLCIRTGVQRCLKMEIPPQRTTPDWDPCVVNMALRPWKFIEEAYLLR
jgi:hypothetical protein